MFRYLTAIVLVLIPTLASAQSQSELVGARVRATVQRAGPRGAERFTGDLVAWTDSLRVSTDSGTVVEPRANVVSLEVSTRRSRASSIARAAALGGVTGLLVGGAYGWNQPEDGFFSNEETMMLAGLTVGGIGVGIGALVGAAVPLERWRSLDHEGIRVGLELPNNAPMLTIRLPAP